jgi:hypothetical protein
VEVDNEVREFITTIRVLMSLLDNNVVVEYNDGVWTGINEDRITTITHDDMQNLTKLQDGV